MRRGGWEPTASCGRMVRESSSTDIDTDIDSQLIYTIYILTTLPYPTQPYPTLPYREKFPRGPHTRDQGYPHGAVAAGQLRAAGGGGGHIPLQVV
jgi:hypothetical protein